MGSVGAKQPTSAVPLSKAENDSMLQQFTLTRNKYENNLDTLYGTQSVKAMWTGLRDAADRLIKFGGVPRTSTGYAADVIFETAPYGTTVVISGATNSSDDGTWIKGASVGNQPVWTHLTKADGSQAPSSYTSGTSLNVIGSHNDNFRLRINNLG